MHRVNKVAVCRSARNGDMALFGSKITCRRLHLGSEYSFGVRSFTGIGGTTPKTLVHY